MGISAGVLAFSLLTLHDLQMAEGAGLYLAMQCGVDASRRLPFDILVDIVGMVCFVAAILLPCMLLKRKKAASFLRLLSAYIAFVPIMHPGNTVHIIDNFKNLSLRQTLLDGNLATFVLEGFSDSIVILQFAAPLAILLPALNKTPEEASLPKCGHKLLIWEILLLLINILFPSLSQETSYLMHYSLLVWCFWLWERMIAHYPKLAGWSTLLFGGCLLRGIYKMIELMSITHL